ncbi:hypothetical protein EVAR_30342_1 [Eumeta japonica]|uniref:C2H2-type domain-containing protein n=1 Tax=Eumeta variegata TaxID=151549 RepID=A0A4C1W8D7_EUMVA|nr:hypothetical protein EVAR_30342_1 [Eumeta japonica]
MTSQFEVDAVVDHDCSGIKLENESQNKDDNTLTSEHKQIFDSCRTVYHDPVLQNFDYNHSLHHDENAGGGILYRHLSKVEQEDGNDAKDVGMPSNDRNKIISHISEEVIIKTEDNIKLMDHQEDENCYNFTRVKVEMQVDDAAEQKDNVSNLETHSKIINPSEQEVPDDSYYRLPESYYSCEPLETDERSVDMVDDKVEMRQEVHSALEARDTNSLLKIKKLSKAGKTRRYDSLKKKKIKQYRCLICFASYRQFSAYLTHKNKHLKKGTHQFLRKRREGKHLKMIRGIAHFQCDKCNKCYTCEASLNVHIKMSHGHVPIKIIKTEPEDVFKSDNLNLTHHEINTEPHEEILSASHHSNIQSDSGPPLLKMSSELENLKYSILLLQQDSINAAEDMLNEVKMTYYCPECLKFFAKSASYRSHLNTHLKKKFMLLRSQKIVLLKTLKDMNKFPYFSYNNGYIANINANKHLWPTEINAKSDKCVDGMSSSVKQCSEIVTAELQQVSNSILGDDPNNSNGNKGMFTKDGFQREPTREYASHSLGENCTDNGPILLTDSPEFGIPKENECIEIKSYSCSKCSKHCIGPSAFREHLNLHLREEMNLLYKKKKEMYKRHMSRSRTFKCEKCDKEYLYDGFLKKHKKFCQGPPRNELKDIVLGCNINSLQNLNRRKVEISLQQNNLESNIKSCCDPTKNLNTTNIANAEPERTISKNGESGFTSQCDSTSNRGGFRVDCSDVEQKTTFDAIMTLINETQHFMSHTNTYHLSSRERWLLELLQAFFALMQSWECKPCNFRSENPDTLAEHLHDHRTLNVVGLDLMPKSENCTPKRKCVDCRRIYSSNKQLEEHRGLYHNPNQGSRKKSLATSTVNSDNPIAKCLKCNIQFISEGHLKAHFCTMRHVEVQSFLLNEQFVAANMSEVESVANIVVTID